MSPLFTRLNNFLNKDLWDAGERTSGALNNFFIAILRLSYKIGREFLNGDITRRASSLAFTTLLTIVPLLAIAFSLLKALGIHNTLEPFLREFLAPLGEKGGELTLRIIEYVQRVSAGLIGAVGFTSVIYTVISTVQQIEGAFNYLWQITEERDFVRRFKDYMSVILIGPVLIVTAIGVTTSVMNNTIAQRILSIEPFGTLLLIAGKLLPYLLISGAFTFLYFVLPYTKVRFRSALVGGVSAGILWEAGSWAFATFMVTSTRYSAIYAGFAVVLLFMLWLYYNWVIILTGAKISFYHQFPTLLSMRDDRLMHSERTMRRLAIALMYLIGFSYYHGMPRWTLPSLIERLQLPKNLVQDIMNILARKGLVLTAEPDQAFVPARDIGTITIGEVASDIGEDFRESHVSIDGIEVSAIDEILNEAEKASGSILSRETVKDLVLKNNRPI